MIWYLMIVFVAFDEKGNGPHIVSERYYRARSSVHCEHLRNMTYIHETGEPLDALKMCISVKPAHPAGEAKGREGMR